VSGTRYGGRTAGLDPEWTAARYCKCGHHRDAHTYESGICLAQMCKCESLRLLSEVEAAGKKRSAG
jgi:hypothetical protein